MPIDETRRFRGEEDAGPLQFLDMARIPLDDLVELAAAVAVGHAAILSGRVILVPAVNYPASMAGVLRGEVQDGPRLWLDLPDETCFAFAEDGGLIAFLVDLGDEVTARQGSPASTRSG